MLLKQARKDSVLLPKFYTETLPKLRYQTKPYQCYTTTLLPICGTVPCAFGLLPPSQESNT